MVTEEEESGAAATAAAAKIVSPMPGTVTKVFCTPGQKVTVGDTLISVESMKMEYLVKAKADGEVEKVLVSTAEVVGMK